MMYLRPRIKKNELIDVKKKSNVWQKRKLFVLLHSLKHGAIAQLVEQRTENPCVPGSIPGGTTFLHTHFTHFNEESHSCEWLFFLFVIILLCLMLLCFAWIFKNCKPFAR